MSVCLDALKNGGFNVMNQERQPDGSMVIRLLSHKDNKLYRFQVKDLYGENEEVLWEEVSGLS